MIFEHEGRIAECEFRGRGGEKDIERQRQTIRLTDIGREKEVYQMRGKKMATERERERERE